ncbi:PREDICTED: uncharacterized protein LOC104727825, partial [Camelina sativa]|uniref:Uncharacterized protein LOC104727825 n=1 Tax=Camelina sativa TaxID=90675 RepID=A0ABM0URV0_CAMSA
MDSFCLYTFNIPIIIILLLSFHQSESQSTHLLDLMIRDYTIRNFKLNLNTGITQTIHLPSNFSGIDIDAVKLRCGSLRRYGAKLGEFHIGSGVTVEPCPERVMLIRQNLGSSWSSIYSTGYNLTGENYQLVSPVLGLLAYNANPDGVATNPYEVNVVGTDQNPILVDFLSNKSSIDPNPQATLNKNSSVLCACFTSNGNTTISEQVSPYVCKGTRQGHYALVMKTEARRDDHDSGGGGVVTSSTEVNVTSSTEVNGGNGGGKLSRWKVAVGSVIGSGIGAILLGMLVVAMLVKVKKKAIREEMERRAYEEEALQVSMVGHVRASTAPGTRTLPRMGDDRYKNTH